jgi:transposase
MMQQRRFTKEFEAEAVRLVQTSGRTQREIAGDLGIGLSTLVRWSAGAGIGVLPTPRRRQRAMSRQSSSGCAGRTRSSARSGIS